LISFFVSNSICHYLNGNQVSLTNLAATQSTAQFANLGKRKNPRLDYYFYQPITVIVHGFLRRLLKDIIAIDGNLKTSVPFGFRQSTCAL
jgi:hypothetical protein